MNKITHALILPFTIILLLPSCRPTPDPILKIGLVSGFGGFHDRGFNQNILDGYLLAKDQYSFFGETREIITEAEIGTNIDNFLSAGFNLIITAGFNAAQATIDAAKAHPETDFLILDYAVENPPANLLCVLFDVDESSFPCGFLAAYWANRQDPLHPVAGFVAGPAIPEIRQFSDSYTHGIEYFNQKYHKDVRWEGYFANSFADTLQGAILADSLLRQNASVIFAFAGKTGNGALYKVKEAGKWAIGVDVDQYISIPEVGPVLLTSCVKLLNSTVYSILVSYFNETFAGGQIMHYNLNNNGVGMAPLHDFKAAIPDSIEMELVAIEAGIKKGEISTGWK
ncbi:MAG: BMP family ABC transporter substrate-binding protein [Bacteroidales bacterium]|jgi:basic membrane protein A